MEIWKDIEGYEGLYQVSNLGRVKSHKFGKEKILKILINSHGYAHVILLKEGKRKMLRINRLVYQEFNGDLIENLVIDHISGDILNNSSDNLQQINQRNNITKAYLNKRTTSKYIGVSLDKPSNKWRAQIKINGKCKFLGRFDNEEEAAQVYQNALEALNKID